jgi:long-subunit acyl-CoA synthetase (AMP-forming)
MIREELRLLVGESSGFKPFEVGEELTMTFKLKRHVITEKYAGKIKAMAG